MTAYRALDPRGGRNGPDRGISVGYCHALFYDIKAFEYIHVINK